MSPIVPEDIRELHLVPDKWYDRSPETGGWRRGQHSLAEKIAASPKKIVMLEAECGTGKSVIPAASALSLNYKAIILIQTISLQQQYLRDLQGLKMMSGRRHSICNLTDKPADHAPCTIGAKCALKGVWSHGEPITEPECHYFKRKAEAQRAPLSVHNYAYWMGETSNQGSSFDKVDMIICDEAHELDQIMMGAGIIPISYHDCDQLDIPRPVVSSMGELKDWCKANYKAVADFKADVERQAALAGLKIGQDSFEDDEGDVIDTSFLSGASYEKQREAIDSIVIAFKRCQRILIAIRDISVLQDSELAEWALKDPTAPRWTLEAQPIYGKYGFRRILASARHKVVLMSAFLAPELLCETLGLKPEDVEIIRAPKVFDRSKSRIFYCPTVKLSYKMPDKSKKFVIRTMDLFADYFANRKGIIHVPSVSLRNDIMDNSRVKARLLAYDGSDTAAIRRLYPDKDDVIAEYVRTPKPAILVGQSVSTGLDLPYVPTWQIITKVAFPPLGDPAVEKRKKVDKNFYTYLTICQIVQAAGRVKRAADHDGPTIIIDSQFGWFYAANKKHFPAWFRDNFVQDGWRAFADVRTKVKKESLAYGVFMS